MQVLRRKGKYESEVQLGLLAIVFLLLFLNFISNVVIYRARSISREAIHSHLNASAVSISRTVQARYPGRLSETEMETLKAAYRLNSLNLVPSRPADQSVEGRRRWFGSIVKSLPPGQLPDLADKLIGSEYRKITRGEEDEYFYVYPIPAGAGQNLLITSVNEPSLAFLDGSGTVILIVGLAAMLIVAIVYLLLYRYIFSPFRKIKEHAARAGREVDLTGGDVDAVVEEYQHIIDELRSNEEKLLKLNQDISNRADSLEQFNEYLLSSIDSGMITVETSGRILSINRAAGKMLSINIDAYQGASYSLLFESNSELQTCVDNALTLGRVGEYREIEHADLSGKTLYLGVTVSEIRDHDRRQIGFALLLSDLTELQQLRAELETRHRLAAMGEMAGGLAHQLRNSLGAIAGYGNLVKRKLTGTDKQSTSVDSLIQEVREAESMIGSFLDFARPIEPDKLSVTIEELVGEVISSFTVRERYQKIRFQVETQSGINLEIDPVLLKQALSNLLDNACKAYSGAEGTVMVRTSSENGTVRIIIKDFGCGMTVEDKGKIFTPFFSLHPSGTGLGLPLVAKIVDMHDGHIHVESEPERGSTFTISLPLQVSLEPSVRQEVQSV